MAGQPVSSEEQSLSGARGPVQEETYPPAAVEARDRLLAAIGAEAQAVAQEFPGQASAALAELARSYAWVLPASPTARRLAPASHWTDHVVSDPAIALLEATAQGVDQLSYRSASVTVQDGMGSASDGAAASANDGEEQILVSVSEEPAVAEARGKLLAAIGAEAQHVAATAAGQAATALADLARAYTLAVTGFTAVEAPVFGGEAATGNGGTARFVMVGGSSRIPRI